MPPFAVAETRLVTLAHPRTVTQWSDIAACRRRSGPLG
jgi:hypothetical protein